MRWGAVLGAAILAATPLHAQENPQQQGFTPEDDLDCAIYVGALMAEMGEGISPANEVGLTSAFTYFVGRYEAQRGPGFAEAMLARYPEYQQRGPAQIEQTCTVRIRAFSMRLQQAQALTAAEGNSANAAPDGQDAAQAE